MDWERFRKLRNLVKRQLNFQASNLYRNLSYKEKVNEGFGIVGNTN